VERSNCIDVGFSCVVCVLVLCGPSPKYCRVLCVHHVLSVTVCMCVCYVYVCVTQVLRCAAVSSYYQCDKYVTINFCVDNTVVRFLVNCVGLITYTSWQLDLC